MTAEETKSNGQTGRIKSTPGYVDSRYLAAMTALLERQKGRGYELLHVEPGHRVLDLGCGPATDTINLAGMAGPDGRVVGVDHDPEMVAQANERAETAGVRGWTEHVRADAIALPFESETFDRVHAERIFQHLPQPDAAFSELVRVTRAGGLIYVAEPDWGTLSIDCAQIDLERRFTRFFAEGYMRNGYAGRHLYHQFVTHRLEDIAVEADSIPVTNYTLAQYTVLADRMIPAAVAAGALTQDEVDRLGEEWQRADAEGTYFATCGIIGVVGRKP